MYIGSAWALQWKPRREAQQECQQHAGIIQDLTLRAAYLDFLVPELLDYQPASSNADSQAIRSRV